METVVVGIGDGRISDRPDTVLVTYALGSCIAVAAWDPVRKVGGLLHFLLPEAAPDERTPEKACRYGDTGTPWLFRSLYAQGAVKSRLVVTLAGGANVVDDAGIFNIGKRNITLVRRVLWKAGVAVHAEAVGGAISRTVGLEVSTGRFWVREPGAAAKDLVAPREGEKPAGQQGLCFVAKPRVLPPSGLVLEWERK